MGGWVGGWVGGSRRRERAREFGGECVEWSEDLFKKKNGCAPYPFILICTRARTRAPPGPFFSRDPVCANTRDHTSDLYDSPVCHALAPATSVLAHALSSPNAKPKKNEPPAPPSPPPPKMLSRLALCTGAPPTLPTRPGGRADHITARSLSRQAAGPSTASQVRDKGACARGTEIRAGCLIPAPRTAAKPGPPPP